MASFSSISIRFQADLKQFSSQMQNAQRQLSKAGKQMQNAGRNLTIGLTAPLTALGYQSVKTFANFEQALAKVEAVSGATTSQMKELRENAEDLGASTRFAASEVAGLQLNLSKLGFNPKEILQSTDGILALAQATGEDLANSATVAASTLQGFGLDASETSRLVDVMADSFSSSALDLSKFQTAMATVAPVAKTANQTIEDTTGLLAVLVNAGLDASTAGTGLRNIFLDTAKSGLSLEEAFEKINSSTNKNATAMDLFGKRGATVATVLAENADKAAEFTTQFENAEGSAKRMAKIMDNTLEGAFMRLRSAMESFYITIGEQLAPVLSRMADMAANIVSKFKNLDSSTQRIIVAVGALAAAIGPVLLALGTMATTVIPAVAAGFTALTGPIGLVVAAIAGIAAVIYSNWDTIKRELNNLANYFVDLYNESAAVRLAVEQVVFVFKTLYEIGRLVITSLIDGFKNGSKLILDSFKNVGEGIKAILTGQFSEFPKIILKQGKLAADSFGKTFDDLGQNIQTFTDNLKQNFSQAIDQVAGRKRLVFSADAVIENVIQPGGGDPSDGEGSQGDQGEGQGQQGQAKLTNFNLQGSGANVKSPIEHLSINLPGQADIVNNNLNSLKENMMSLKQTAQVVGNEVGSAFSGFTDNMLESLELADHGFQGFVKSLAKTVGKIISMMLSQSISQAIAGATASGAATGPGAVFATPGFIATAVGGVMSAFAAIPKFADGGIVTAPTLGIMGEYANARSNPEIIAPLDRLRALLPDNNGTANVNVAGQFSLRGRDLVASVEQTVKRNSRVGSVNKMWNVR